MNEVRSKDRFAAVRQYGWRTLILMAGAGLAVVVWGIAFAGTQRAAVPDVVLKWNGQDAGAYASLADRLVAGGAAAETDRRKATHLATKALLRDPTQVKAARVLGLVAAIQGRPERAERLMDYADYLSRRDVPTQLWLIEREVRQGDVDGVLAHYDAVLRTSPAGQDLLFPVLARAVDEPVVYEAAKNLVARKPPWARAFVTSLLSSRAKAEHISGLALVVLDGSDTNDEVLRQRLIARLADRGEYGVAYSTYASLAGSSAAKLALRNGDFERQLRYPPIDWDVAVEPDFAALAQPAPQSHGLALHFHAAEGRGGRLARQLLHLPAGRYQLSSLVANVPSNPMERPLLELRCADQGSNVFLKTVAFPTAGVEGKPWGVAFTVPNGRCDYQWLTISSRGTLDEPTDVPWIDHLEINAAS
jgi:hypothetical protein